MTTYFAGPGGNDGNAGTSWATRKLTLNGVEDIPVVAGDIVYVGPGTYRESLTLDVTGSSGSPITYIGDVTGENTDDVGGYVRISGSDDDQSENRSYCITAGGNYSYRTFRGFTFDGFTTGGISISGRDLQDWIIEDCYFEGASASGDGCIRIDTASEIDNFTIRRSVFNVGLGDAVRCDLSVAYAGSSNLVENCLMLGGYGNGLFVDRCDGWTIKNCLIRGMYRGVMADNLNANGYSITANNCIIFGNRTGFQADATGGIVEDYNNVFANSVARQNTSTGSNSVAYLPLLQPWLAKSGLMLPWNPFHLASYSTLLQMTQSSPSSDDLYDLTRPTTSGKKSLGPIQWQPKERETTTTRGSSTASAKIEDAGEIFVARVPVDGSQITVSIYVNREANYAGTNPTLICRQAGQSDNTDVDTGSSGAWNELSCTFTPSSTPGFVEIYVSSFNTATSGSYAVYIDDLTVS